MSETTASILESGVDVVDVDGVEMPINEQGEVVCFMPEGKKSATVTITRRRCEPEKDDE